jgi:uncharacterized membrane protein
MVLRTIFAVAFALWLLGFIVHIIGGTIHIILGAVLVIILFDLLAERYLRKRIS